MYHLIRVGSTFDKIKFCRKTMNDTVSIRLSGPHVISTTWMDGWISTKKMLNASTGLHQRNSIYLLCNVM